MLKTKVVVLETTDATGIEKMINLYLERHPSVEDVVSVTTFMTAKPAAVASPLRSVNSPQHVAILNVMLVVKVRIEPAQC